ncbi:unnamed protein product [Caenorhabditis auriculariae]|uniref:Uncharacterized protein n=1 Tax=Caenorhabditis auriculariae TaxID=2777116 RepID=A0A8S1HAL6_9PELO|nr:unnamed protein product [Caenorhabditis auriculariae]
MRKDHLLARRSWRQCAMIGVGKKTSDKDWKERRKWEEEPVAFDSSTGEQETKTQKSCGFANLGGESGTEEKNSHVTAVSIAAEAVPNGQEEKAYVLKTEEAGAEDPTPTKKLRRTKRTRSGLPEQNFIKEYIVVFRIMVRTAFYTPRLMESEPFPGFEVKKLCRENELEEFSERYNNAVYRLLHVCRGTFWGRLIRGPPSLDGVLCSQVGEKKLDVEK